MTDLVAASAIVLAGGRSQRFGSEKLAVELHGEPLLHHVTRIAAELCDEVLLVGAPSGLAVSLPADLPVRPTVVLDDTAYAGPLVALAHAAEHASRDRLLLLGGDMPHLVPAVLRRVLTWEGEHSGACLVSDGWAQPFPMGLDREATLVRGALLIERGERSLRSLMASIPLDRISEEQWRRLDPDARTLHDIDRPEDVGR